MSYYTEKRIMLIDTYDNDKSHVNRVVEEMKQDILKNCPMAVFDEPPFFKVENYEQDEKGEGRICVPYYLAEIEDKDCTYQYYDHIYLNPHFKYYSIVKQQLQTIMRGANFIDLEAPNENSDKKKITQNKYGILLSNSIMTKHKMQIIKVILELITKYPELDMDIGFTNTGNDRDRGGMIQRIHLNTTLFLSKLRSLKIDKETLWLRGTIYKSTFDLMKNFFEKGKITDRKLEEFLWDIYFELAEESRSFDEEY